jgi:hypothetical protein
LEGHGVSPDWLEPLLAITGGLYFKGMSSSNLTDFNHTVVLALIHDVLPIYLIGTFIYYFIGVELLNNSER